MTPQELKNITSRFNVLYVEDDIALQQSTKKLFSNFFNRVDTASDGEEGLALYKKNLPYDIVISDINMPKLNGVEMVMEMKKINDEQLILITSAYSEADNLLALMNAGVTKFVLKPLNLTKLMDALIHISLQKQYYDNPNNIDCMQTISDLQARIKQLEDGIQKTTIPKVEKDTNSTTATLPIEPFSSLEEALHQTIYSIQMRGDLEHKTKENLLSHIASYAHALEKFSSSQTISQQLFKLDTSIEEHEDLFVMKIVPATQMLEDMTQALEMYKTAPTTANETRAVKSIKKILAFLRL